MEKTLDYQKIWTDYGFAKDNPLGRSLAYLFRCAKGAGLSMQVAEQVVHSVFLEVLDGVEFSTEKCRCGCGIDASATDIIHYMAAKIFKEAEKQDHVPYLRKVIIPKKMNKIRRAYRVLVGREI